MSEVKHTEGPWEVTDRCPSGRKTIRNHDTLVAYVAVGEGEDEDASLLAAAPDLFEALKPFAAIGIGSNPEYRPSVNIDREFILAARAAIAKARGESA